MVSPICFFFVTTVKNRFGYDDSLDVFGVHCIGGITGAIMTGVLVAPSLGGQGLADYTTHPGTMVAGSYDMAAQVWIQCKAVLLTLVWSGVGSTILYLAIDKTWGMRATEEEEFNGSISRITVNAPIITEASGAGRARPTRCSSCGRPKPGAVTHRAFFHACRGMAASADRGGARGAGFVARAYLSWHDAVPRPLLAGPRLSRSAHVPSPAAAL